MVISTSNIGRRSDGSFEEYVPPGVVTAGGGLPSDPTVDATPVAVASGAMALPGMWIVDNGTLQVSLDPAAPGQTAFVANNGTAFVSTGTNASAMVVSTLYRVRG